MASFTIKNYLDEFAKSNDKKILEDMKKFFIEKDYIAPGNNMSPVDVKVAAERILKYRNWDNYEGK